MDRSHSMSGKKDLDWFFANKRWVRTRQRTAVEAAFALRPLPADSKALQILLLAPKRTYKRAHDRNRVKRYLREAIAHTPGFSAIEAAAGSRQIQVLVMLRYQKPLEELTWELALKSMQIIAASIGEKI